MTERKRFVSLHLKLMLVMLGGFLAGICTFFLASRLGDYLIETRYMSEEALHRRNMAAVENLQAFIKDNNLSSRDTDQLAIWSIEQKDIYIMFYKNRHLAMEAGWWGVDNEFSLGGSELNEQVSLQLYPVSFRDGVFQALHVQKRAGFVVDQHDADQNGVRPQGGAQIIHSDVPGLVRLEIGHFIALLFHNLSALQTELHPGIGVDAVINTVMARLVAAGHATICRIDDSPTIQRSNVSTPEIDSILKRGQFRQPGNLLCCQFSLQIGILHFKKSLADGSRMTNIHQ